MRIEVGPLPEEWKELIKNVDEANTYLSLGAGTLKSGFMLEFMDFYGKEDQDGDGTIHIDIDLENFYFDQVFDMNDPKVFPEYLQKVAIEYKKLIETGEIFSKELNELIDVDKVTEEMFNTITKADQLANYDIEFGVFDMSKGENKEYDHAVTIKELVIGLYDNETKESIVHKMTVNDK